MAEYLESLFIAKGDKGFGFMNMPYRFMNMPYRKKPCLTIKDGNTYTKVASFNNQESAVLFMDYVAEMFSVPRKEEE